MNKTEFVKKYSEHYQLIEGECINKDNELVSDLNEVLKDELEKFAEFINGNTTSHLFDEITNGDIESYFKQKL